MPFYVKTNDDLVERFVVKTFDPATNNATIVGAGMELALNLTPELLAEYEFKLVREDGSDAKLEELQAGLQAGIQDAEASG